MGKKLKPMICDTRVLIQDAISKNKKILFEGAQGALLDVEHGTYPYVTSSNTTTGGIFTGCGIGPKSIAHIIGISKAYTTRVGTGPFPTELFDEVGDQIRKVGKEFGSTTGRPRRCGWLDIVALKYAVEVNGLTGITLMKADVMNGFDEVKICVAYEVDGKRINQIPSNIKMLERAKPVYESHKGWKTLPDQPKTFNDLPAEFKNYIEYVEKAIGVPVVTISTGPGREQTLNRW